MKLTQLIILLSTLCFFSCHKGAEEPQENPIPEPTPAPSVPVPDPTPAQPQSWWMPGPIKSFQIFHFDSLADFKKELKAGTQAVTLELDAIEERGGKSVVDHAHSQGAEVICYFSEGYEDWRSDQAKYPKDAMGKPMDDWDGERWGDPRKTSLHAFLGKRMDRCKALGADGLELDNMDQHGNQEESGIKISKAENIASQIILAKLAHSKGLAIFQKNAGDISKELVQHFDGAYVESCHRYDECDAFKAYKGKPVAMIEYGLTSCAPFEGAVCQKKLGYFK